MKKGNERTVGVPRFIGPNNRLDRSHSMITDNGEERYNFQKSVLKFSKVFFCNYITIPYNPRMDRTGLQIPVRSRAGQVVKIIVIEI